jgi:hypothetical protein
MESNFLPNTENELLELSRQIEKKRHELESENNIIDKREVVKHVVSDVTNEDEDSGDENKNESETKVRESKTDISREKTGSYIDSLDGETLNHIQNKINVVFEKGVKKGIKEAKKDFSPHELDAFHDLLVDRLYDELKSRGLV